MKRSTKSYPGSYKSFQYIHYNTSSLPCIIRKLQAFEGIFSVQYTVVMNYPQLAGIDRKSRGLTSAPSL
jgi:hypothetical protein